MTFSGLVNQVRRSNQCSDRQGEQIVYFIVHGQASLNDDATIGLMVSGGKQVSANYTVSNEGRITGVVDEEYRAWTSGSSTDGGAGARFDRRAITVEVENATGAPEWGFSAAAQNAVAGLMADCAKRHPGIRLVRIQGVLGHRELWTLFKASYPTSCPQAFDLDGVTARAAGNGGAVVPATGGSPAPITVDYAWGLTEAGQLAIQQGLARLGRYKGDQDGKFGGQSVSTLQQWLVDNGYLARAYDVDGVPGDAYGEALHDLADKYGYTGTHAGKPGVNVSAALIRWANTLAPAVQQTRPAPEGRDWSYWEPSGALAARIQRALSARGRYNYPNGKARPADGQFGEYTRMGVQTTLSVSHIFVGSIDGKIERGGCYGIQQYAAKFGDYEKRGGKIDGAPRELSWECFAVGLERRP